MKKTTQEKGQARLTADQIRHALEQASGNVAYAARSLQVSRSTLYRRINESAQLRAVLQDAREELVDIAESALKRAVLNGEGWAVCFALKTLGKSRGYVERQELTGPQGGAIVLKWGNESADNDDSAS